LVEFYSQEVLKFVDSTYLDIAKVYFDSDKFRAVERTEDFTRGPGKILKYDLKRGKFCSLGPPFEVWAPVEITTSPPLSTDKLVCAETIVALDELDGSIVNP
jgi:hypothetical protein